MEPAAVLVGAFKIKIGWPFQIRALFEAEGVGAAGIEPDIENIADLFPIVRVVYKAIKEPRFRAVLVPGVGAFFGKSGHDPVGKFLRGVEALAGDELSRFLVAEHRDRHPPRPLP